MSGRYKGSWIFSYTLKVIWEKEYKTKFAVVSSFSGQELWEQQKVLEEQQREAREKERLESLKKKEKHEQSAVASSEVKQKLQVM